MNLKRNSVEDKDDKKEFYENFKSYYPIRKNNQIGFINLKEVS